MKYIKRPVEDNFLADHSQLTEIVREIIRDVQQNKDQALLRYNQKFDQNPRKNLRISPEEIRDAYSRVEAELIRDMETAAGHLKRFAQMQRSTILDLEETEVTAGVFLSHRVIPIEACCCYVPGGRYPLFSTALMLAIPAKVAGVKRITACAPAMFGTEKIHPAILVALDIAGVDEIYAVGGAHAIAAFSYGTEQIQPVDIIVGPGNQYVTEAKRQCYGQVGIDFVAGPSEVLVIADDSADSDIVAADLLAQCEHDLKAAGILVTTSESFACRVIASVDKALKTLPTAEVAGKAWDLNGVVIVADSLDEACDISNSYAPEHLEIQTRSNDRIKERLTNYGSLFEGSNAAEVFGDYVAGTNHTLPTLRASRYTGGLYVGTFLKTCTSQRISDQGIRNIAAIAERMARAEGLEAHGNAAAIRIK